MAITFRFGCVALGLVALTSGCGNRNNPNDNQGSGVVLRETIGIDLAQVSAFVAVADTSPAMLHPPSAAVDTVVGADQGGGQGGQLYALTTGGDVQEVPLVELADGSGQGTAEQPPVAAIYATDSWILFESPGFQTMKKVADNRNDPVMCSMIATRRLGGALYCAPLYSNRSWTGQDPQTSIFANAAGDVVYAMMSIADVPAQPPSGEPILYRIMLSGESGPTAVPALDFPMFILHSFRVNGTGDLYLSYIATALGGTMTTKILPLGGGSPFIVQGAAHCDAVAGEPGAADQDTFYVVAGGCGGESFNGVLQVVTKSGGTFTATDATVTFPMGSSYDYNLHRLADGVYMFSPVAKALLRVIADGAVVTNPTPIPLTGITQVVGLGNANGIDSHGGFWVFIAQTASGYEFVRHNGISQQDIPFDSVLDIRSFTASSDGAIDFLAVRTDTQEKVRGSIAAGSTVVTLASAGVLDPAQVVVFTQVN